ncbi:hypothetical protein LINGRAHAP2_LOCUS28749 [Linum grandiflorum]
MAMGNNKRTRVGQSESTTSSSILPSKKNTKNKKNKTNNSGKPAATIKREKITNSSDGVEVLSRRPKVYITDISNFKKLVQELTGNNGTALATTTVSVVSDPVNHTPSPVSNQSESDSVDTFSPTVSVDSSSDQTASFGQDETVMMMMMNNMEHEEWVCNTTSSDDHYDLAAWDDLDALMQEMDQDQFPLFETSNFQGAQIHHHNYDQEDLSIYDYDFSGIVC